MGWFDSDSKTPTRPAAATAPQQARETQRPAARTEPSGSTIGRQVRIEGTIVAEENLAIFGRVQGTIHAHQKLVVAAGAQLEATIHGRQVEVAGKVAGDIKAADAVLLRPSAQLAGNVETPSLCIEEGAFFVGSVKMQKARPETGSGAAKAGKTGASAPPGICG